MAEVRCVQLLLWVYLCVVCHSHTDAVTPDAGIGTTVNHISSPKKHSSKPLHTMVQEAANSSNSSSSRRAAVASSSRTAAAAPAAAAAAPHMKAATSLVGNLLLLLISVVIAGSLFLMLLCFIHKWRENMGTSRYPRVVYSMLRQSEDEPEDVLGEILINIGLAAPEDARPLTPSSSDTSESPQPSDHEVDISDLDGTKFTTIPLKADEAAKRLMAPEPEESDEELLQ